MKFEFLSFSGGGVGSGSGGVPELPEIPSGNPRDSPDTPPGGGGGEEDIDFDDLTARYITS